MSSIAAKLVFPLGVLLALGCAARTPLDFEENGDEPGAGGNPGLGGQAVIGGAAGNPALGGRAVAGGVMAGGGRIAAGGGAAGINAGGGAAGIAAGGGAAGIAAGGGAAGIVAGGGAAGTVSGGGTRAGGVGGGAGGQAGFGPGGSTVTGGRSGGAGGSAGGAAGFTVSGGAGGKGGGVAGGPGGVAGGPGGAAGGGAPAGGSSGAGGVRPAGGTIGAGGTVGAGGTIGTGGSTCQGPTSKEDLIDDLNDGDRWILPGRGRYGEWKVGNDGTPGGVMSPDPTQGFTPNNTGDACRKYAAYVKGYGFTSSGANLSVGLGSPYNASSFWARVDSGTTSVIRVAFPDKDTDLAGGICTTSPGPTNCWDHFGTRMTFSTTWTKYSLTWSQLTQDGWGLLAKAFDSTSLYGIIFEIPENATFGLWIDNLALVYLPDLL
jgi:hypothetical protein